MQYFVIGMPPVVSEDSSIVDLRFHDIFGGVAH